MAYLIFSVVQLLVFVTIARTESEFTPEDRVISMVSSPSPLTVVVNNGVLIRCTASGRPKPVISWKFGNKRIATGGRYELVEGRGLKIHNVSAADGGSYTCRADVRSDGRLDERVIVLDVHTPPTITQFDIDAYSRTEGSNVTVSCLASGWPRPTYLFYKNGNVEQLKPTDHITIFLGTIMFIPVRKSDEGSYRCRASNSVNDDTRTGYLRVYFEDTVALLPTQRPVVEVNECSVENGYCEQVCTDTRDSYRCGCYRGTLRGDGRTCTARTSTVFVLSSVAAAVFLGVLIWLYMKKRRSRQWKGSSAPAAGEYADSTRGVDEIAPRAYYGDQPMVLDPHYANSSDQAKAAAASYLAPRAPPDIDPPSYADLYNNTDYCSPPAYYGGDRGCVGDEK